MKKPSKYFKNNIKNLNLKIITCYYNTKIKANNYVKKPKNIFIYLVKEKNRILIKFRNSE